MFLSKRNITIPKKPLIVGADLGTLSDPPPTTSNFEAQIFAAAATLLHNDSKISLGPKPLLTQILDPHLN